MTGGEFFTSPSNPRSASHEFYHYLPARTVYPTCPPEPAPETRTNLREVEKHHHSRCPDWGCSIQDSSRPTFWVASLFAKVGESNTVDDWDYDFCPSPETNPRRACNFEGAGLGDLPGVTNGRFEYVYAFVGLSYQLCRCCWSPWEGPTPSPPLGGDVIGKPTRVTQSI